MPTDTLQLAPPTPVVPISSVDRLTAILDAFPAMFQLAATGFVAGTVSWTELLMEIRDEYMSCSHVPADLSFLVAELMVAVDESPVTSVVLGARMLGRHQTHRRRIARWQRQTPQHQRGRLLPRA